ncbi:hypothetical protein CEXT_747621 [Caerostris extrusa]|uniref:Uncharacterized protein n=1 Tax=Caerostris extrusa TaxID=172846 RepID=A0AAV4T799_CAEEX|nr:hypothetical protein CEXT_747621 [Caerostris extrusa]
MCVEKENGKTVQTENIVTNYFGKLFGSRTPKKNLFYIKNNLASFSGGQCLANDDDTTYIMILCVSRKAWKSLQKKDDDDVHT